MDEEIEEVIENVKQTDSQKSVATTNLYSLDFIDSSSDKLDSSGMETYILEWDSEGSESPRYKNVAIMKENPSRSMNVNRDVQCDVAKRYCAECSTSFNRCSIFSQEIFTQTSKTIIELAQTEETLIKHMDQNTLHTQTSFISIKSNKTLEYQIEVTEKNNSKAKVVSEFVDHFQNNASSQFIGNCLEDNSTKLQNSESELDKSNDDTSVPCSEKLQNVINEENEENIYCDEQNDYDSDYDHTDFDDDSLMESDKPDHSKNNNPNEECETPKSMDTDVAELYNKLYERMDFQSHKSFDQDKKRFDLLTPLTEESAFKKDWSQDAASENHSSLNDEDKDVLFTNKSGIKIKLLPKEASRDAESLKLPPIQGTYSCPTSPKCANTNFLFSINPNKLQLRSGTLPCVFEERRDEKGIDRWEIESRELASGESHHINERINFDRGSQGTIQLPPIHFEVGYIANSSNVDKPEYKNTDGPRLESLTDLQNPINITDKIKELKMSNKSKNFTQSRYSVHNSESRSGSPSSVCDDSKLSEHSERGCELLCIELLRRLRSPSWFEVMDTLDDIPKVLAKFWGVIAENRIADLLRQIISHVESPRTQVSRTACNTLAAILKNTNYTKKPEFYEAVTILLIKTGSFSRPVRRAANVALDDIVCGVDLSHVVTALCIHGVTHKSPLVRCASARLLVVCCALGGGGRDLLRTRPPTAAYARKHALRSLAALLDDKNTDTRKYAERLYTMLRPLTNFEAFYLTDVDVELASRQMKKYDHLLLCSTPESR
ncbi:unnamed protein product [Arctia plantaginis]|uniref:TOG domain-containing protein n=1 Tax=Arctia plantaginis TaxID=874455 RepID=A0A8S1AQI8_ARCPL|nr:unnamed protein product [Arctia plantaginis]